MEIKVRNYLLWLKGFSQNKFLKKTDRFLMVVARPSSILRRYIQKIYCQIVDTIPKFAYFSSTWHFLIKKNERQQKSS